MKDVDLIALAGLLHDVGKFGQRAGLEKDEGNLQLYCPFRKEGGYFTHQHALYTAKIIDELEKMGVLSKKILQNPLFKGDDSFINTAAMHHKPETLLQWIVAIADRVASGFERETFEEYNQSDEKKNYLQSRLFVPFAEFESREENPYRYKLQKINAANLVLDLKDKIEPQDNKHAKEEYAALYEAFIEDAKKIKPGNLLAKIESLLEVYTTFIPSATAFGTKPNVSLFDHMKATSAFAVALYKYHKKDVENTLDINTADEWKKKKFLVVVGDFFGIQKFIFSSSVENNKALAKTLRGKSAMVSLITELATLKIVQKLELASTSVIQNVAGKFMIVADNTEETKEKLKELQQEFQDWFLEHTFGESGIGLAWTEASCEDFSHKKLAELQQILRFKIEDVKARKFDLINLKEAVFTAYLEKLEDREICRSCNIRGVVEEDLCALCNSYKRLGEKLANSKNDKIYIYCAKEAESFDIFGYEIAYTYRDAPYEAVYDFSLPDENGDIFQGYPKRTFKAYVPLKRDEEYGFTQPKTFEEIAKASKGKEALAVLKADIDNLGTIFIEKLPNMEKPNFAKYNMVSRLINNFFTINLPYFLQKEFSNIYTVFAGGDDLFLIGSWSEILDFSKRFKEHFDAYFVTDASKMSFSASITLVKPSTPVGYQARVSEEALEIMKAEGKNGVRLFENSIPYRNFFTLLEISKDLEARKKSLGLSTGFFYGLIELAEMKEHDQLIENTMWNSKLRYLGYRNVVDKQKGKEKKEEASALITKIGNDIQRFGKSYEVALFKNLYEERKNAK